MSDKISQTSTCPKCKKQLREFTIINNVIKTSCADCGVIWSPAFEFDYEIINPDEKLTNKEKRNQKDSTAKIYVDLKNRILRLTIISDVEIKHIALKEIDSEFSYFAPKKYNAYFELSEFYLALDNPDYNNYLNSRIKKMAKDINKILFYFSK